MPKIDARLKVVWIAICVLTLTMCVLPYNATTNRDNDIVLYLVMIALAFPSAYLVVLLYSGLQALHVPPLPLGRIEMLVLWVGFFIVGYVQWFVLTPWIIRVANRIWLTRQNTSALPPP
mgnify:FL=1